ncbi:endoglucanase 1 [Sistotremastrum suecicum HHB10207 ss-3]|uniref:cellulase n=1 Tax=Sistotremastrum suecicum HHB10207 ss-3 TaxID=1314776 RepID=A0A166AND3_9AGAM|nr:endoglucanase 1 [Sistotremastrum suecicum HHB10207 ss-3]
MLYKFAALSSLVATASSKILYAGVSESGGEFGVYSNTATPGTGLPGRFGVDYAFINKTTVDIFVDQEKINIFRITFLMERMCPVNFATGKGLGSKFNETYFSEYADAVNYVTNVKGAYALIDPHNYMRYNDPSQQPGTGSVIGNTTDPRAATSADFKAFWNELASRFRTNPRVVFGIQNEPHDMPTSLVLQNDQYAIDGIREAGAPQLILAPGNGYTGGHSWTQASQGDAPSSEYLYKLVDPLKNTAIEVHEYLDVDFSGGHANCTSPGPTYLANLTSWLQQHNLKAVVGEFGGGANQNCYQYIDDLLTYLADNDEYVGWIAWAAGPIWGTSSACCGQDTGNLEPNTLNDLGQPGAFDTVWKNAIHPNIPKVLKRSGVSSLTL